MKRLKTTRKSTRLVPYTVATTVVLAITALSQYWFGRVIICKCGFVKLWHGAIWSSENSQHVSDWYTFSHIIHGFAFYYLGVKIIKKITLFQTFLLALGIEAFWEILENSSFIINRYRETTVSLDYYGDSILNSLFDILAMVLGFYLARRLLPKYILILTIVMEVVVGALIRDNLTLNIIMLIHPFEAIKAWQLALHP